VRNFQSLHQRLPGDIVFAALSDTLGWDPVSEEFGKLESRERWPIPWLEDDPSMWLPQFRASRFESDMQRAQSYGCEGMLGIHWRHRIVDPTATYFARAAWDPALTATAHYRSFSAAQASGERASSLAGLITDCDQNRNISSTFRGAYGEDGHAEQAELSGDYSEAFNYESNQPDLAILPMQRQVAESFNKITGEASTATEKERLGYFSAFVGLMVPYCDALELAHELGSVLTKATELRAAGKEDDARELVLSKGVPLWLTMSPLVRQTMLTYQSIVSTRNDQGQLASMQNKFVRISLERLRLSIKEFLGELPAEVNQAYESAITATSACSTRVFMPTRPSLLAAGDAVRVFIVVPGEEAVANVLLHVRPQGRNEWSSQTAKLAGRHVYEAHLGPFEARTAIAEYYVSATIVGHGVPHLAPLEAPQHVYRLSVLQA